MFAALPDIEEGIPLPAGAAEALPELSPVEELNMRARTIKLLADMQGDTLLPRADGQDTAQQLARQMMEDPKFRPDFAKYPNDITAYLAGLVAQSNCMIVDDLAELKLYVVNKLVKEVEEADNSKVRIMALKALGEVDGVDAFKKRSELTVKTLSAEEVENKLRTVLENVKYRVISTNNAENTQEQAKNLLPEPEDDEELDNQRVSGL